jgi:hypothetical protein
METRDGAHAGQIFDALKADGYRPARVSGGVALD